MEAASIYYSVKKYSLNIDLMKYEKNERFLFVLILIFGEMG